MNKVTISLYRSLIRVVHQYEKHPELYSLLYSKKTGLRESSPAEAYYTDKVEGIFAGSHFFPMKNKSKYLRTLIRKEFRTVNKETLTTRIAAGFTALRRLSSVWTSYLNEKSTMRTEPSPTPPPSLPIKNVSFAEDLIAGTFLIANPLLFGTLKRGAILCHD